MEPIDISMGRLGATLDKIGVRKSMDLKNSETLISVPIEDVIPHVFLPRDLPQEEQKNIVQVEQSLLEMLKYVFSASINNSDTFMELCPTTYKLLQRWVVAQNIVSSAFVDPSSLKDVIPSDMEAGEMIALYIRSQNAGVFLSAKMESPEKDKLILSSFKASQGSTEVMSSIGDRTIGIPQQSIWVSKTELLRSNEFARQLCILNQTQIGRMLPEISKAGHKFANVRDVAHPHLITDWATLTLSDADSKVADADFPKIQKTVRDDVRWRNALIPFRRSGLWFTAKAALQTSFIREFGEKAGILLYKAFMIQVMDFVLECHHSGFPAEMDTKMQMMSKLARRMEKLQLKMKTVEDVDEDIIKTIRFIIDSTISHLKNIQSTLSHDWSNYSLTRFPPVQKVLLSMNQLQNDLMHRLGALINEIDQRTNAELLNNHSGAFVPKPNCPFRIDPNAFGFPSVPSTTGYVLDFELRELEEWILLNIDKYTEIAETEGGTSKTIRSFIKSYLQKAKTQYSGDPVATGRMVRTILNCIKVLDEIATREHPILLEHKTGIDMEMFGVLLAPFREDMEVIHELESYFRQRDSHARFLSFLEEFEPTGDSVSVRFAEQSQEMLQLRKTILVQAERDIIKKHEEVRRVREECDALRRRIGNLSCECRWNDHLGCSKCSLQITLGNTLFSVSRYERPLPNNVDQQCSIVFDLLVPSTVACLRDMLFFFRSNVCGSSINSSFVTDVHRLWRDYDRSKVGVYSTNNNEIVSLASTLKPSLEAHSGRQNPSVDSHESEFILNNGMNTLGHAFIASNVTIKEQSTFCIVGAPYVNLQWTLNSTSHTSNQVLAKQNNCHQDMNLDEFKRFGSLRAGHRIQYRNLLMSFSSKKWSLKSEGVFQLVFQAMWEAEKQNLASPNILREAHVEINGTEFTSAAFQLLEEMVAENSENWSEPFVQLNVIAFASRICELTTDSSVKLKAAEVLKKCRHVCRVWTEDIKKIIGEAYDAPEENKNQLKLKLIDASIALVMTFFVGKENFGLVMENSEDALNWLMGMSTLYNEVFRDFASIEPQLSRTRRYLLRCIMSTAVLIEKAVVTLIENDFGILYRFTKSRWPACDKFYSHWDRLPGPLRQVYENEKVVSNEGSIHTVHVDILLGKFLVDGCPVGRLSEEIVKNELYQRVFQGGDFQVQRDILGVFTTTLEYYGCLYTFYLAKTAKLIIKEIKLDCGKSTTKLELIPETFFNNELPVYFIRNFSHWWDRQTNQIHFRTKNFQDPKFKEGPEYTLHLKDGQNILVENVSSRKLIYINSDSCKRLTEVLQRIESVEHTHIWVEDENPVEVELVRFNLKFLLKDGDLHSHEYPGYKLSHNQNVGTLIGLRSSVVLEGPQISEFILPSKLVIVPHGQIKTLQDDYHRVTLISSSLRSPPFLAFEVDERLKTLKAGRNQSAWFFLAALHATTSSPLTDVFTGLTGTEMALHILQSARSYSCKPYDPESLKTLQFISSLSPKRSFYPEHLKCMENVSWPMNLSPLVSHDAYVFIVQKLLSNTQMKTSCTDWSGKDLQLRHYWRHMLYANNSMKIDKVFFPEFLQTQPPPAGEVENLPVFNAEVSSRLIAHFNNHVNSLNVQSATTSPIKSLLLKYLPLRGLNPEYLKEFPLSSVASWIDMDLRDNWINLYNVALSVKKNGWQDQWKLILSSLAFNQQDCDQLLLLQAIAKNPESFPPPLYYAKYDQPTSIYSEDVIKNILLSNALPFPHEKEFFATYDFYTATLDRHNLVVQSDAANRAKSVTSQWPCDQNCFYMRDSSVIDMAKAQDEVNSRLFEWYQNLKLKEFIDELEDKLRRLLGASESIRLEKLMFLPHSLKIASKFSIDNEENLLQHFATDNTEARRIYKKGEFQAICNCNRAHSKSLLAKECKEISLQRIQTAAQTLWEDFAKLAAPEDSVGAQVATGLYPRIVPLVMFKMLLRSSNDPRVKCVQDYLGAIVVLWTLEQRYVRSLTYLSRGPSMQVALERELETMGYENWSPREYPGWVLLQLESNMMIRPIQVKVAKEMMSPKSGKNSVMQLNMGEGKSCLIVPMLAVALADGKQLCRITVLKSIFETNFNSLVHTLGGLLGQRVITVPCRRDLNVERNTSTILNLYKSTMANRGVVVTLPEFRLSFQLKGYENAYQAERVGEATNMLEIQRWLNANVRDILDESDEILSVTYQLVYTMGSQVHLAGGNIRWEMAQKLLKLVPLRMKSLWEEFGDSFVEIDTTQTSECFGHCRLLNKTCYQSLVDKLTEDFLNGEIVSSFPHLKIADRNAVKTFLTGHSATNNRPMSKEEHSAALKIFEDSPDNLELIFLFAGYLKYEVLCTALSKRWKVNYGVKKDGHRKMAVPFKAKDVASERTEFGHPDMAIILTQLSYYYSGLSDEQLLQCFEFLSLKQQQLNPADLYDSWLKSIPPEKIHDSVKSYGGLNLDNFKQRTQYLFPMLRKAMVVIDFWLSKFVFPRESKQFPGKITGTPWDVCSENQLLLTTGFSGTNDFNGLYPVRISQHNLQELQSTDECLEKVLVQKENRGYKSLPPTGKEKITMSEFILKSLHEEGIRVLLDCGALMLEMSNEEVAKNWLEIDLKVEGVVYFNSKNSLTVKMRGSRNSDCPLELSPFRERLDTCAVYLDDDHTRGTDLKFPRGSRACVTLGAGITRDKLVQACMRMRMLGNGHSVTFWASHEAHSKISTQLTTASSPTSADVLCWVKSNSREFVEKGLVYWTASAVNYVRKLSAEKMSDFGNSQMQRLGELCVEDEVMSLMDMYGKMRSEEKFVEIIPTWFNALKASLIEVSDGMELPSEVKELFIMISTEVVGRCKKLIPDKLHFSQLLDEEQEKELENELEEEKEPELPGEATPAQHRLFPFVKKCIELGRLDFESEHFGKLIKPIPNSFEHTELAKMCDAQYSGWGDKIFATSDFITTIIPKNAKENVDEYLRSPAWVVSLQNNPTGCILLLISPFEANKLIPEFRSRNLKSTLHLYIPRLLSGQKDILIDKSALCVPPVTVPLSHELLAPLSLFSGALYFNSHEEEEAFAAFLQIIPREGRTPEQNMAFEEGKIALNGFVQPECRSGIMKSLKSPSFEKNPNALVKEILRMRNQGTIPEGSHVKKLAVDGISSFRK